MNYTLKLKIISFSLSSFKDEFKMFKIILELVILPPTRFYILTTRLTNVLYTT